MEFRAMLQKYENAKQQGSLLYLDSDDFVDLAEYYMEDGQLIRMLEVAEDGLSMHPDDEYLISLKVNALISLHKFDMAEKLLDTLDPEKEHDVYYFRAQLACAVYGDDKKATELFRQWIEKEYKDCRTMKNKDEALSRCKDAVFHIIVSFSDLSINLNVQSSIDYWTKEYVRMFSPLRGDDTDLEVAKVCHDSELFDREIEVYSQCLESNPYMRQGWTYLASLQHMYGFTEDSLNSAENAIAVDPNDINACLVLAHANYDLHNYEAARKYFIRYIEETHDESFLMILGKSCMFLGKKEEGYEYLKSARRYCTKHYTDKEDLANNRAFISDAFYVGGYLKDAHTMIKLALRYFPTDPQFNQQEGKILLAMDNISSAWNSYQRAVDYAKKAKTEVVPLMMSAGCQLLDKGYLRAAEVIFENALKEIDEPEHRYGHVYLAYIYFAKRKTELFVENLRQACRYTPKMVNALWKDSLIGVAEENYYEYMLKLYKKVCKNDDN